MGAPLWVGQDRNWLPLLTERCGGRVAGQNCGCGLHSLASTSSVWAPAQRTPHLEWLARLCRLRAVRELSTQASSFRGGAGSPSTTRLPSSCLNSCRASVTSLQHRAWDLQTAMSKPPTGNGLPHGPSLPQGHCPLLCGTWCHPPPKA